MHNLFLPPFFHRDCACGEELPNCAVWSEVLARLEKVADMPLDEFVGRVATLHEKTGRTRHLPKIKRGTRDARQLADLVGALYAAIAGATNSPVVIDSSKGPAGARLLRLMPYDYDVVHIYRDPVATIQSNAVWGGRSAPPRISGPRLVATSASIAMVNRHLRRDGKLSEVELEQFLVENRGAPLPESHQCEGNPSRFGDAVLSPTIAEGRTPRLRTRVQATAINRLRSIGR
ncbi:MAG: hypothetical protein Q8K63_04200 [Acidimicrobiales bacterium]|nr:hypothetical protein [Acidimicrobiales bacterium]